MNLFTCADLKGGLRTCTAMKSCGCVALGSDLSASIINTLTAGNMRRPLKCKRARLQRDRNGACMLLKAHLRA